jgi:hypothetical protein
MVWDFGLLLHKTQEHMHTHVPLFNPFFMKLVAVGLHPTHVDQDELKTGLTST